MSGSINRESTATSCDVDRSRSGNRSFAEPSLSAPSSHMEIITARLLALIGDENACVSSRLTELRRARMPSPPSSQTISLQDRIASFARGIREKVSQIPPGKEREMTCSGELGWLTPHPNSPIGLNRPYGQSDTYALRFRVRLNHLCKDRS
jgi:hypothetical protein